MSAVLAADEANLAPQDGLLLLRSGGIVAGRITRAGDRFYVAVRDGEIRVKVSDVELVCRDLEDGFARKRAAIAPGHSEEHIALCEWCLRQSLIEHARQELNEATALDSRNPQLQMLAGRIEQAVRQQTPAPPPTESQEAVTNEDLDRMVRGMPPHAVEVFTQTIQPLLINSCAAAGCHGPRAESHFQLVRTTPGKAATRRPTQRNLQTVMQYVDAKNPSESPLLIIPTRAHGTSGAPIFTNQQSAQYQQLVDWVASVSLHPVQPATLEEVLPGVLQSVVPGSSGPAPQQGEPAVVTSQTPKNSPASMATDKSAAADKTVAGGTDKTANPKTGAGASAKNAKADPAAPAAPVDPFDPEVFNRRFHQ